MPPFFENHRAKLIAGLQMVVTRLGKVWAAEIAPVHFS